MPASPAIHILDLAFIEPEAIAAFLIETQKGPVLVECGPHSVFANLEAALGRHGYRPEDISHVFLSHIHFDHAGAAWALAQRGAVIHVHPAGYKHLLDPSRLYQSASRIYGDQMEKLWGRMEGIAEAQMRAAEPGQAIRAGEWEFIPWFTPGHAVHHIAWQVGTAVFTGDVGGCRIGQGPVVPPCPPPDIDVEAWQDSIRLLRSLDAERFYLTHFGAYADIGPLLDTLEARLLDWAAWMRPHAEQQRPQEELVPLFQAYVAQQLRDAGAQEADLAKYEAANPAFMSVGGLMRYWSRKLSPAG
jgi:glyoxylase-like metal-dependent hydrolase (beta-lactamase superfamily II)